jgi:hypothetical protein
MVEHNLCKAEFATLTKEKLLKAEPRRLEVAEDRKWRTEGMIELVAKPTERRRWEAPPILDSSKSGLSYYFDIRPDCAYWLFLRAFNMEWQRRVREYVLVMNKQVTCPYFTIEFKRDEPADTGGESGCCRRRPCLVQSILTTGNISSSCQTRMARPGSDRYPTLLFNGWGLRICIVVH